MVSNVLDTVWTTVYEGESWSKNRMIPIHAKKHPNPTTTSWTVKTVFWSISEIIPPNIWNKLPIIAMINQKLKNFSFSEIRSRSQARETSLKFARLPAILETNSIRL